MNRAIEILKDYKKELEDIKEYYQQSTDDLETIEDIDKALQLLQTDVSQQRELLEAYQHFIDWNEEHDRKASTSERIEAFITSNCG